MKCKYCKKEFEARDNQKYCSWDCKYLYEQDVQRIKRRVKKIAKEFNLDTQNVDKIANAKMMLFAGDDVFRCPCAADDKERYCGSLKCLSEIYTNKQCHCGLFKLKDTK